MLIVPAVLLLAIGADSIYIVIQCEDLKDDKDCFRVDALGPTANSATTIQLHAHSHRQPATHTSISSLELTWRSKVKSNSGFGVEIVKSPRYEKSSRRCLFVEIDDHPYELMEWRVNCPSLFLVKSGVYNISVHLSPSGHTSTSTVFINEKIGDVNSVYSDAPAFWATDIVADISPCSAELTITFQLANPAYKFSKYTVRIWSTIGATHSVDMEVDQSKLHASYTFSGILSGRYNVTITPIETSRGRMNCVCQCTRVQQAGCTVVPGCLNCMLTNSSSAVYVNVENCDVASELLQQASLMPTVLGALAAAVLLCGAIFVGLAYNKPDFSSSLEKVEMTREKLLPTSSKRIALYYWDTHCTVAPMVEHLHNLLRRYCACDVTLERPLPSDLDGDYLLVIPHQSHVVNILVLTDFTSDHAQMRHISDDNVIIARLQSAALPSDFPISRRIYTLPEELYNLCLQLHDNIIPPTFNPDFMSDPDDAIPLLALLDMAHLVNVYIINRDFELPSEYTCTCTDGTHQGSFSDLRDPYS